LHPSSPRCSPPFSPLHPSSPVPPLFFPSSRGPGLYMHALSAFGLVRTLRLFLPAPLHLPGPLLSMLCSLQ
ncbi:hypothetical protein CLOM_g5874, partial [Closterium sp. NIES-68]